MANIPHSSRYRSAGNKASANAGAAGLAWSAQNDSTAHGRSADQPANMSWLWVLVGIGLLIAFPYHVLGFIGLALFIGWFVSKQ